MRIQKDRKMSEIRVHDVKFNEKNYVKNVSSSWYLFTEIETLTTAEIGTKDWGIIVIDLTLLLFGGMWILGILDNESSGII